MNLKRHTVDDIELWIGEAPNNVSTAEEVIHRDIYRVRKLAEGGFKPKVIVDIGAMIGTFTVLAAKTWPEARICSFEPTAWNFAILAANLPPNATATRMAVLGFAGDEKNHTILPSHGDEQRWRDEGRGMSFRQVLEMAGGKIDFLKIDCEQSELNILREAHGLNELRNIEIIHGEWHLPAAREYIKAILPLTHELEIVEGHDLWDMFWARRKPEPARRNLIYTVACGVEYGDQAELMIQSLREFGKFTGDIVVFSDDGERNFGGDSQCVHWPIRGLKHPIFGKMACGAMLETKCYDRVMFLDTDILIINPIESAFSGDVFLLPCEMVVDPKCRSAFSLPDSTGKDGLNGFNSGTIVGPAASWACFCEEWLNRCLAHDAQNLPSVDQPLLNDMIQTGRLTASALPDGMVHFFNENSAPVTKGTVLVHFKNPHKLESMKCVYGVRKLTV